MDVSAGPGNIERSVREMKRKEPHANYVHKVPRFTRGQHFLFPERDLF